MNLSKKQEYLIIAGLLVLIFPFFALLAYVHPQGDDFFFAAKVNELGVWGFVKDMYFHWSGRYASMFIGAFDPLRFESLTLFRISLLLFQLLFITSIFTLFRSIIKTEISNSKILIFSLAFYAIFINGLPDVLEFLYWFPSVTAYQLGISLYLIFLANFFFHKTGNLSNIVFFIFNSLLAIIIIGLIELFVIPMIITSLIFLFYSLKKKKNFKYELSILGIIVFASLITVLAPGNFERMSELPVNERLILGTTLSIKGTFFTVGYFFQSGTFILSSILFLSLANLLIHKKLVKFNIPRFHPAILILASIFTLVLLFFPASTALRYLPPGRVFNLVGFFLFFVWLITLLVFVNYFQKIISFLLPAIYIKILFAFLILSLFSGVFIIDKYKFAQGENDSIFINGNILNAYYGLFYEAKGFDQEMRNKRKTLEIAQKKNKKTIHLQPLSPHPKTLLLVDWNEEKYHNKWLVSWEAKYYNLDSIYIEHRKKQNP